jgi:hypothetical protein
MIGLVAGGGGAAPVRAVLGRDMTAEDVEDELQPSQDRKTSPLD